MHVSIVLTCLLLALAVVPGAQPQGVVQEHPASPSLPKNDTERKIMGVQQQMLKANENYLNVPEIDGKALRLLAEAVSAQRVLEIGTSTGYSGLWFCLALHATGGHLTTFEIDHGRATLARRHFEQAGVSNLVTIVEGDAHQNVPKSQGPFDVAFIDAEKPGYVDYLHKVLPLVRPGGLILAHNIEMAPEYVKEVTTNPDLETIFYMEGNKLSVTLKKR